MESRRMVSSSAGVSVVQDGAGCSFGWHGSSLSSGIFGAGEDEFSRLENASESGCRECLGWWWWWWWWVEGEDEHEE